MKKTLTLIVALLLVACLTFVFVACDSGDDTTPSQQQTTNNGGTNKPTTEVKVTDADIERTTNTLSNYADAWMLNKAASDIAPVDLQNKLSDLVMADEDLNKVVKLVKVSNDYKITIEFRNGKKVPYTPNKVVAEKGELAGYAYDVKNPVGADETIGTLISAAMKTIKQSITKGEGFSENGFGFAGEAYFEFNYGDLTENKLVYSIRTKGNIAKEAKDTDVAIEVLEGNKILGGLYYDGAASKEACRLYLQINIKDKEPIKYYINYADINAIVAYFVDNAEETVNEVKDKVEGVEGEEKFYDKYANVARLTDLFDGMDASVTDMISSILNTVLSGSSGYTTVGNVKRYQLNVDIDKLLTYVSGMGAILSQIDLSELPAPINQLDLGSFQGIGGALLITADVDGEGALAGLELSYNCAKQDFRWSATDTKAKVYGPVNVALGVKDFNLNKQTEEAVLATAGDLKEYTYFSPLNADVSAEYTVKKNDGEAKAYNMTIKSDVNPFNIGDGKIVATVGDFVASFSIVKRDDNGKYDCMIVVKTEDDKTYSGYASEGAWGDKFKALGTKFDKTNNVVTPVIKYVEGLVKLFGGDAAAGETAATTEEKKDGLDFKALIAAFSDIKDLVTGSAWSGEGKVYVLDTENYYFKGKIGIAQYDEILDILMPAIANVLPEGMADFRLNQLDEDMIKYVPTVEGEYKHEDDAYVKVTIDEDIYYADVYMKEFDFKTGHGILTAKFVAPDGTEYKGVLNNKDWDTTHKGTFVYTVTKKDQQPVTYIDADLAYVENGKSTLTLKVKSDKDYNFAFGVETKEEEDSTLYYLYADFDDNKTAVYCGNGYFKYEGVESTSFFVPCIEMGCDFGYDFGVAKADVSISKIALNSWGEAVSVNALQPADEDLSLDVAIGLVCDDIFSLFDLSK